MSNREVAAILYEVADLLEIKDVKFKPVAYRRAAHEIETLSEEIGRIAERDGLEEIPGVGTHIATKLREILDTGKLAYLDRMKQEVGPGVRELAGIGGIGPKKAMLLHRELGIDSMENLEAAARAGKIRGLTGFGEKSEQNLLLGIAARKGTAGRSLLGEILPVAETIRTRLAVLPQVRQIRLAGSLRRMKETIGDIDIIVASAEPEPVMAAFVTLPEVSRVLGRGLTKSSIVLASGVQVDLRVVDEGQFWTALLYFTGSKDHNIALRRRALGRGWSLSEYGVKDEATGRNIPGSAEEDLYRMLGLPYIEPELRENTGEIEAAEKGTLPRIVPYDAVKGDLHVHSQWSDGRDSIRDLAETARARGYEYIAICDHSRSAEIDRGLTVEKVVQQRAEIEQLNRESGGIPVLHGVECNINEDGTLDLPSAVLRDFDLVIASIHSRLRMHGDEMTRRLLAAIHNENVDILGHPTGRILLRREPADLDLPAIFETAAAQHVALEINAYPSRLDLSDTNCRKAKEFGVNFSLGSDAHATGDLAQMQLGIATARRGWVTAEEIINTRSLEGLRAWLGG
ncbi:DNA polymerase/3'-5' exonuclease PolX [Methanoregula sp.]|uniref:DNA polymerase/3'-5' exonuclease PolX n=1 Tax=Methanoregula sp. TaxID=2052170 RepID=UPI003C741998